jgi:hypothetical protein
MYMFCELNAGQMAKPESIILLLFMSTEIDFPFTRILFHINSTLNDFFLPLNHI